ncbi:phosphoglycolate phosphatase [Bacterioplanes sanyensis]|uniref:Phosphoglycolate phosphatase n=1 Tax=Bacterioplanes sanyensis TaxID=1249553 RepID=A0A222FNF6_9GAMM|nr:phosphoglycolate phosphatase [Bacterioplanes sanyensis]ASP40096.1 phosphoglycolate phosphatase [Bacterioplanes sanyensis]
MAEWHARVLARFTPELVLFDLDGTLIDSVPDLTTAIDAMLQQLGRAPAGREQVSHWVGNGADALVRRALTAGDETAAWLLTSEQVAPARQAFDQAYMQALHHATGAYDGVEEFLRSSPAPMVLVTNKPRVFTEPLLQSLGWQPYFQLLLCGDDLAQKKPHPAPLLHACEQLGVAPQQALMVGDSRNDVEAAKAASIACAAVSYGYNHGEPIADSQPDWLLDDIRQLLAL